MKASLATRRILAILGAIALTAVLGGCGKIISSGHRGVYFNWRLGTDTKTVLGEGFQWLAPWNKIFHYDIRTKDRLEQLQLLSQDQLQIRCDVSIRYKLVPAKVGELHARVGKEFYRMLIQPVLRNTTRDVVSSYKSIEAYQSRIAIQSKIQTAIKKQFERYDYFEVESVLLRNLEFPKMVVDAIERKLSMKQEADREKFRLEKAKIAAQRQIVEAQATARAQEILKATLDDRLLRWKGIEATLQLAESKNTKIIVVGAGSEGLPLILGNSTSR